MMNLQQASESGLLIARRQLIQTEPPGHNPLDCSNPATCPKCEAWGAWAKNLMEVNREITARQLK
jgi:hypothetical protein